MNSPLPPERQEELKEAIRGWDAYAMRETFPPAALTGERARDSLKLELATGVSHCVCCLKPLTDCPAQSQNRRS